MNRVFVVALALLVLLNCNTVFAQAQPWDFLRPLNNAAEALNEFTTWVVFLLSVTLTVIAVLAYRKKQSKRYAFIAFAFVFFSLKWLLKVIDLYLSPGHFFNWAGGTIVELVIFACLFIALFKR